MYLESLVSLVGNYYLESLVSLVGNYYLESLVSLVGNYYLESLVSLVGNYYLESLVSLVCIKKGAQKAGFRLVFPSFPGKPGLYNYITKSELKLVFLVSLVEKQYIYITSKP